MPTRKATRTRSKTVKTPKASKSPKSRKKTAGGSKKGSRKTVSYDWISYANCAKDAKKAG